MMIFNVDDVFFLADGETVFVGRLHGEDPGVLVPTTADLLLDGSLVARIRLVEERMPGPDSRGRRALVTRDDSSGLRRLSSLRASVLMLSPIDSGS